MTEREQLEQAIARLEAQRAALGDDVVATSVAALREKLAALERAPEQRKQVSVLFGDVSGYTAMSETMDAEVVNDVMNALWQRIDAAIVEHGGRIDKHTGDGVMALWGADTARESDPERAVRAALAIQAALAEFSADHDVSMRIGVSTGPVLLGTVGTTGEFSAIGDTVNLASRLEEAAPTGGLLISHDTYRHVRGVFDVREQEPVQLKGKARPVQTYVVERAKPRAFRMSTRGVAGIETRMVGRDAELVMLQNMFTDVVDDAVGRVVTIVGDAGVGKSRLLYEFENWIELLPEQVWRFEGRAASETQTRPYGLVRGVFADRFDILDSDSAAEVREKFRAGMAAGLDSDQADLVGQLLGFDFSASPAVQASLGSESLPEQATTHLTTYLRNVAQVPTVIILEDVHWADDSSLDLLDELVMALPGMRLLVVCLARPTLFERRPGWGGERETHSQIDLDPLSRPTSRALVGEILQRAEGVPRELRDLIVERAEGNPFYVEELVKMLIEDGVIVIGQDHWWVELNRLAEVRVPPTLAGVLQARLDSLTQEERAVLQRASVVGRIFWAAVVADLAGDRFEAAQVDTLLNDVRKRELIFRRGRSVFEATDEYIFKHALLRDVTYETVLLKLRPAYHARVARWLESSAGERIGEHLGQIAMHYELGGEVAKAVHFLRRLGEEASEIGALRDAVRSFERALALLAAVARDPVQGLATTSPDADLTERAMLLVKLGHTYDRLGDRRAAIQRLEQGLSLARQAKDPRAEMEALNRLAQMASEEGSYERAQGYLDEVLGLAREQDDRACVASALSMVSSIAWRWGDFEQAERCCHESLEIYRELDDRRRIVETLNILGILARLREKHDLSEQYYEQSLSMAREMADRLKVADILNNLGYLYHYSTANLVKARQCYEESLLINRGIDHQRGVTCTLANLGQLHVLLGDREVAWGYLREALDQSAAIGAVPLTLDALLGVIQLQIDLERYLAAAELLGLALSHPAMDAEVVEVAESTLGELRKVLRAEQLEAALDRGKALDLDAVVAELGAMDLTGNAGLH
jgi:class 3 adenylate cyclase/tetratricopeptide (TPR) repeat protein